MAKGFVAMDGMTAAGLRKIYDQWGAYFQHLGTMITGWSQWIAAGVTFSGLSNPALNPKLPTVTKGQAGIVSQMLVPEALKMAPSIGQTPYTTPSSTNYEKRDIKITVDGNALSPYIQRVVVNTLMEIERNRG
jgi:hypothetical protein